MIVVCVMPRGGAEETETSGSKPSTPPKSRNALDMVRISSLLSGAV